MRELVYLSQAKLQQFRKPTNKKDGLSGGIKVTAAGLALPTAEVGLNYDPAVAATAATATLAEAEKFIRGKWPVRWWTEEQEPGEWIQFETRLAYGVLGDRFEEQHVLFFWGRDRPDDVDSVQLLLHGSPRHLIQHISDGVPATRTQPSMSSGLFSYLRAVDAGTASGGAVGRVDRQLAHVIKLVRDVAPDLTAGWLSGMARTSFSVTTGTGRRIVVASPLFVEHIPAPK
ncbi:hypothetical protein GCM10029976_021960 [Kribbella albertanoniae]|uniref:Uncharacterized protein n=1 Tax=Kribbella albertanoniae TaxID=1266829 RepID=A0A4R4Q3E0_9ACTN|nr:SAVMC3_10250 family protein [Kribbella albertanoniae]TDC29524.1 hypothetical protein E1261_15590 [Kribbella albertanoniae]